MMLLALRFHAVSHAAAANALTMREWETLARVFGELEAEGFNLPEYVTANVKPGPIGVHETVENIRRLIRNAMYHRLVVRGGLGEDEWIVFVRPGRMDLLGSVARRNAWGEMTWIVDVHLLPEVSAAKKAAIGEAPHAPTLAEQYGAAKR